MFLAIVFNTLANLPAPPHCSKAKSKIEGKGKNVDQQSSGSFSRIGHNRGQGYVGTNARYGGLNGCIRAVSQNGNFHGNTFQGCPHNTGDWATNSTQIKWQPNLQVLADLWRDLSTAFGGEENARIFLSLRRPELMDQPPVYYLERGEPEIVQNLVDAMREMLP